MQFSQTFLDLSSPKVMGILNITPDSFSDGGDFIYKDSAIRQVLKMVTEGASIIDIGGESTRPGADSVSIQQELDRVIPVIETINHEIDQPISIDTSKAEVMKEAVSAGAQMINDVNALQAEHAMNMAAELNIPVCMMHMQGEPRTMQQNPQYQNVVQDIKEFFRSRIKAAISAGIKKEHILIDPGFGFGKSLQHNLSLLKHLADFSELGLPVLVGMSRKSMIGLVTGKEVTQRLAGSIAVATIAALNGAQIIRVHDVAATVDALKMVEAVTQAK